MVHDSFYSLRDVEFQPSNQNTEAVSGEESMVFRLITPKFLCPILVEHEVGKRFVAREGFIVLGVEHGVTRGGRRKYYQQLCCMKMQG